MRREEIIQTVLVNKIIGIVRGISPENILPLADAFCEGGLRLMEITFDQARPQTQADTVIAIRELNKRMGSRMVIGAGTVTSVHLLQLAADAGARFIVSPDTNTDVIRGTLARGMVSMPGAMSATEILTASHAGADFVKVFPASILGVSYIKAVRGPLNQVRLLAVGGIDENNIADYLKAGCVGVGVGGNLCNKEWIAAGAFKKVAALARQYCENIA